MCDKEKYSMIRMRSVQNTVARRMRDQELEAPLPSSMMEHIATLLEHQAVRWASRAGRRASV